MRQLQLAIVVSFFASRVLLAQSEASFKKFTPSVNPHARRLITDQFTLVNDLQKIDPGVLELFHAKVEPADIANRGEPFNSTDVVVENRPARRFVLAGNAPGLWFIWYEHGGIAYHQNLIVFSKTDRWQIAAAVQGNVMGDLDFESLKRAVKDGQLFSIAGHPDF